MLSWKSCSIQVDALVNIFIFAFMYSIPLVKIFPKCHNFINGYQLRTFLFMLYISNLQVLYSQWLVYPIKRMSRILFVNRTLCLIIFHLAKNVKIRILFHHTLKTWLAYQELLALLKTFYTVNFTCNYNPLLF